jgi:hypothetical protein
MIIDSRDAKFYASDKEFNATPARKVSVAVGWRRLCRARSMRRRRQRRADNQRSDGESQN